MGYAKQILKYGCLKPAWERERQRKPGQVDAPVNAVQSTTPVTRAILDDIEWEPGGYYHYADGVYVDATTKGGPTIIACVLTIDTQVLAVSFLAESSNVSRSEEEAVKVARTLWPGAVVFSDSAEACKHGATKIHRGRNGLAHGVARNRRNFRKRV